MLLFFFSCRKDLDINQEEAEELIITSADYGDTAEEVIAANEGNHDDESDYVWESADVEQITFNGSYITENSDGATTNGSVLTIVSAGTYQITGELTDGKIIVNTEDEQIVRLIFNGINVTNSTSAPVFIESAEKTLIFLATGTQNYLTDASNYVYDNADDDEPNAALFSKDNLTIAGDGELTVNANYNDGITSKDGLIISGGNITVNAVDDGIRGKDYLIIKDGTFKINSGGDGLKSDNDEKVDRGYINVNSGTFTIVSQGDAIQAETDIVITGGDYDITSGGGSSSYISDSAKGIKAVVNVIIDGDDFTINSADDAVHSNGNMVINGGSFNISTGDDAFHSDSVLIINSGEIAVSKSYEGIESAVITINDGNIHIKSSDDGLNVAGGTDGSGMGGPGMGGGFTSSSSSNYYLYLNGGYIYIDADGDGLDSNGSIVMTGGTVLVNGPTSNGNGAMDYDRSFAITGGILVAVGSSGMAQAPSTNSTQHSILVNFASTRQVGTMFHIETNGGTEVISFLPTKSYQSVAFSAPALTNGSSYKIYTGGTSSGTETDGLYKGGTYEPGTEYRSFTISSVVTKLN